jgi:hypothetical protein
MSTLPPKADIERAATGKMLFSYAPGQSQARGRNKSRPPESLHHLHRACCPHPFHTNSAQEHAMSVYLIADINPRYWHHRYWN